MATGNAQLVRSSFEASLRGDWARLATLFDAWLRERSAGELPSS